MKIIGYGPGGVLENAIALCGYDNLCFMLVDDPELVQMIFDSIGKRLVRHYEILSTFDKSSAHTIYTRYSINQNHKKKAPPVAAGLLNLAKIANYTMYLPLGV